MHALLVETRGDIRAVAVVANARVKNDCGARAMCGHCLIQSLAARRALHAVGENRFARVRRALDPQGQIGHRIADHKQPVRLTHARAFTASFMNVATRSRSTGFHHTPSRFRKLATITASATVNSSPTFDGLTPEPITTGNDVPCAIARSSSIVAESPVR